MIVLQIFFQVRENKSSEFESLFEEFYVPALQRQKGYLGSKLLKIYPPEIASEFNASPSTFNYQMELFFDNEVNRRIWASSSDHNYVWGLVETVFEKAGWRGFDVVSSDT